MNVNMKKVIITLSIYLNVANLIAQNDFIFNNYLAEKTLLNPSAIGINPNTKINLLLKNYYLGFTEKNPVTQVLSISTKKNYNGIGLIIGNDYFGNVRNTAFSIAYAYHFKLSDIYFVSLAIAPKFRQYSLNQSNYLYFDNNDPVITGTIENTMIFDTDFGASFYSNSYHVALGIKNLFEPNIKLTANNSEENKILRVVNFNSDYIFKFTQNFQVQSAIYLGFTSVNLFYDINARAIINNLIWFGASYKNSKTTSVLFGVLFKNIKFGYSYDYSFSKLSSFHNGTHEIILGYEFVKQQKNLYPR